MRIAITAILCASSVAVGSAQLSSLTAHIIEVKGYAVQVWTGGPSASEPQSPLVIFENGFNTGAGTWSRVAPEVAKFARVLVYNRGGTGKSVWDKQPLTPEHVARNLRELLAALGFSGPYVLVGHSWGGPLIRAHAVLHPTDVSGLVYVDPGTPCVRKRAFEAAGFSAQEPDFIAFMKSLAPAPGGVHPDDYDVMSRIGRDRLPDIPVVVLVGIKPGSGQSIPPRAKPWAQERGLNLEAVMAQVKHKIPCLSPLATEVPRGMLIATPFSGHNIHQDEPDVVISAIRRVLGGTPQTPSDRRLPSH